MCLLLGAFSCYFVVLLLCLVFVVFILLLCCVAFCLVVCLVGFVVLRCPVVPDTAAHLFVLSYFDVS